MWSRLDAPPGDLSAGRQSVEPPTDVAALPPAPAGSSPSRPRGVGHSIHTSSASSHQRGSTSPTTRRPPRPPFADPALVVRCRLPAQPRPAAARRLSYVPSCRGRLRPVSVSNPSIHTTQRPRSFRTAGAPVAFHAIVDPRSAHRRVIPTRDTSVIHPPSGGFAALEVFGSVPVYQTLCRWRGGLEPPTP